MDYILDILEFIKEKNYERIKDIINTKNNDLTKKKNENRRKEINEIVVTINNLNSEIEKLNNSFDKIVSETESSEKAKEIILIYIKNLKMNKNKLIIQKKTIQRLRE